MSGNRKLGKRSDQRKAMLRAMVTYLLENGQIKTTLARAKEVAPLAEKMITLSKKNDLAAYRQALAFITKEDVAHGSCAWAPVRAMQPKWLSSSWCNIHKSNTPAAQAAGVFFSLEKIGKLCYPDRRVDSIRWKESIEMNVLFVNCCIRGEASRTLKLCRTGLEEIQAKYPDAVIEELCLDEEDIRPLHSDTLGQRHELEVAGTLDGPMFRYARQFAAADRIVIGAPYWEYQFPALLRCWVEHVAVGGLTFVYGEDGRPHGLCRGDRILYITTAGGPILDRNCGFDYCKTLFSNMMGFTKFDCVAAECMDVIGYPVEEELAKAEAKLRETIRGW